MATYSASEHRHDSDVTSLHPLDLWLLQCLKLLWGLRSLLSHRQLKCTVVPTITIDLCQRNNAVLQFQLFMNYICFVYFTNSHKRAIIPSTVEKLALSPLPLLKSGLHGTHGLCICIIYPGIPDIKYVYEPCMFVWCSWSTGMGLQVICLLRLYRMLFLRLERQESCSSGSNYRLYAT